MRRPKHRLRPPLGGFPKNGYGREIPEWANEFSVSVKATPLDPPLPFALDRAGYELLAMSQPCERTHFVLYNAWGEIMADWEYEPSYGELLDYMPSETHE